MALDAMIGFNGILGLREESTWGTSAGNSDHWLGISTANPKVDRGVTVLPYLGVTSAQASHVQRDTVLTKHDAMLDATGCAAYDDKAFLLLFKHWFGAVDTTGPVSTQYTHTFRFAIDGQAGKGLSAQVVHGFGLSSPSELYTGCKVNRLELEQVAGSWMTWRANLIARVGAGMDTVAGTPAITAPEEVLAHQGAALSWNSRTVFLRRLKLTLDNALIRRPQIGSQYTDEPIPGGPCVVTVEIERSWEDNNLYADYLSGSQADASIVFTGTGDNAMTINMQNLRWFSVDKPVDRHGELTQRLIGQCFADGSSDLGASIVVKNSNAAAV